MTRIARTPGARRFRGDQGFTLMELLVTMVVAGILFGLAVGGYRAYAASQAHRGTAEALVALMREAQQRAVTQATTYGVDLSVPAGPWQLVKSPTSGCTGGTASGAEVPSRGAITVSGSACVLFKSRGSAAPSPATVTVARAGTSKVYTITVEGLTGRASLS
jgi:prepilin-type N-terminal cleavage/methylation domain-containing protein